MRRAWDTEAQQMRRVWQVRPMRQIQQRRRQQQMQQQMQQQQPKDKNNWGAAQGQGKLWGGAEVRRARGPEKNHAMGRVRGWRQSPAAHLVVRCELAVDSRDSPGRRGARDSPGRRGENRLNFDAWSEKPSRGRGSHTGGSVHVAAAARCAREQNGKRAHQGDTSRELSLASWQQRIHYVDLSAA